MTKWQARVEADKQRTAGKPNAGAFEDSKSGDWFVTDKFATDGTPIAPKASAKG